MKNKLQEVYQKKGLTLPQYKHVQYYMGWQSIVTLANGKVFKGLGLNKKEADTLAARYALEYLATMEPQNITIDCSNTIVLIDLENAPNISFSNVICNGGCIEAFVGRFSSFASKELSEKYPFVHTFHIVESGAPDAVDHAISFRAGQISEPTMEIVIISRDKFAVALCDVLTQQQFQNKYYTNMDAFIYDYQK